jgi:hypothetical protein
MTEKVTLTLKDKRGNTCQFPHCTRRGEECIISSDDQTEAEVILCENHFEVVRSLGQ